MQRFCSRRGTKLVGHFDQGIYRADIGRGATNVRGVHRWRFSQKSAVLPSALPVRNTVSAKDRRLIRERVNHPESVVVHLMAHVFRVNRIASKHPSIPAASIAASK